MRCPNCDGTLMRVVTPTCHGKLVQFRCFDCGYVPGSFAFIVKGYLGDYRDGNPNMDRVIEDAVGEEARDE